jgi:F-type H+-transporting ATPase subunit alpha
MSTILQDLETQIGGLRTTTMKSNVGVVRDCGDGVARIEGLSDVMLNEMIEFPGGLYGIALNLEETEVGAILLGDDKQVTEGTEVRTTGRLLSVQSARRCSAACRYRSATRSTAKDLSPPRRPIR